MEGIHLDGVVEDRNNWRIGGMGRMLWDSSEIGVTPQTQPNCYGRIRKATLAARMA